MKNLKKNLCMGFIALTCGMTTMTAQVTIGSEELPNSGALVDVKTGNSTVNATGGINFPRVTISNFNPATDEAFAASIGATGSWNRQTHTGLFVYNIGTPVGLHVWNGTVWVRLVTHVPNSTTQMNELGLTSNVATKGGTANGSGGVELPFGTVTIPENGAYAFYLDLNGTINPSSTTLSRQVYYVSVFRVRNNVETLADIAEINLFVNDGATGGTSYPIALGAAFQAGDVVKFKLSHLVKTWNLKGGSSTASHTSLIWWRL